MYEVVLDNAMMQVHCHDEAPISWITHDLSTALDDSYLFSYSGSHCEYSSGNLHATAVTFTNNWSFSIPSLILPQDGKKIDLEVTLGDPIDRGSGLGSHNVFTLGSVDPTVEATISDDYNILSQTNLSDDGSTIVTKTLPRDNNDDGSGWQYHDNFDNDVVTKGYIHVVFVFGGFDTKIISIRSKTHS